jgi:AraC-like DNA-binding protein
MHMTTLQPHPALQPYVVRYLNATADYSIPSVQMTGPAGGPALIVLMEGAQRVGARGGALQPTPVAYFAGNLDRALPTLFAGRVRIFAVHLTATGAYPLLRHSIGDLTNDAVELAAISGPDLRDWADALADAPDDATRAAATDEVLLARASGSSLRPHACRVLRTASTACELLARSNGQIPVEALAQQLHTTPRTLRRHFEEVVGLPVRTHRQIIRFLAVRAHLDRHPDTSWRDVVSRFGYADQSHLIRDFQRYYGESPSVFRARRDEARLITLAARGADDAPGEPVP